MEDEYAAACEEFREALDESPAEALSSLRSWSHELRHAPPEAVDELAGAFEQALAGFYAGAPLAEEAWAELAQVGAELAALTDGNARSRRRVTEAWQAALGAVLRGEGASDAADHVSRLATVQRWAGDAVAGALSLHQQDDFVGHVAAALPLMRSAAYFQSLRPDCLPPAAMNELLTLLLAGVRGDLDAAGGHIQMAFEATVQVLQTSATTGIMDNREDEEVSGRAWQFLSFFKHGSAALVDVWWGIYAATLYQLLACAERLGGLRAGLNCHALRAVADVLCHAESAPMLLRYLLANPAYAGGKDGAKRALQAAETLLKGDHTALLSGCAELLIPEADISLPCRQEAHSTMNKAAHRFIADCNDEDEDRRAHLWQPQTLDTLFLVLSRDPSIRVRREAAKLLSSMQGSPQVVRAACLRTRDRDAAVRQEAYAFLLLLPPASLESGLGLADWRCLLDVALLPSGDSGRGGQADKHVAAVRAAGKQLLQQFLTQGEQGRRGWLARLQALMGPAFLGGCGSGAALRAAYAAALHDVLTPADVLEAAAMLYGS